MTQAAEVLSVRVMSLERRLRFALVGWVCGFVMLGLFAAFLQPASSQQSVALTFFGDKLDDITFEKVGYAIVSVGGRTGIMVSGDLGDTMSPEVVKVSLMSATGRPLDQRLAKVSLDTFSVFFPGINVQSVRGIFVEKP